MQFMTPLFYSRLEADCVHKIEIYWLKKCGLLKGYSTNTSITWRHGDNTSSISVGIELVENLREYLLGKEPARDGFIRLRYRQGDEKFDYKVQLCTSDCNYGRFRYWFNCPRCFRRVGVLYCRGDYFACRHCNYLTYESRNLSGIGKRMGKIISEPALEAIKSEVKRKYYNGKPTRKYLRSLRADQKFHSQYIPWLFGKQQLL